MLRSCVLLLAAAAHAQPGVGRALAAAPPAAPTVAERHLASGPLRLVDSLRKRKSRTPPMSVSVQRQLPVPSLRVVPIAHGVRQPLPVLIPLHGRLVTVHDLTVIPLHGLAHEGADVGFRYGEERGEDAPGGYRAPLGGHGAGWRRGGHGAGHGFHYAYG